MKSRKKPTGETQTVTLLPLVHPPPPARIWMKVKKLPACMKLRGEQT